jgi:hypothetical protein
MTVAPGLLEAAKIGARARSRLTTPLKMPTTGLALLALVANNRRETW